MTKKNQNRFWFALVMGMLLFGISMIIWTVRQASSVPVHESNNFMLKYQTADMNINNIKELQDKFDAKYTIELKNFELLDLNDEEQNTNSKRTQAKPVKLNFGKNSFTYAVNNKEGSVVDNAKVSFLLTRPHTRVDDKLEESVTFNNGYYTTKALELKNKGRYTLQFKVEINGLTGYSEIAAYLKP
jgi:hypothetical protein